MLSEDFFIAIGVELKVELCCVWQRERERARAKQVVNWRFLVRDGIEFFFASLYIHFFGVVQWGHNRNKRRRMEQISQSKCVVFDLNCFFYSDIMHGKLEWKEQIKWNRRKIFKQPHTVEWWWREHGNWQAAEMKQRETRRFTKSRAECSQSWNEKRAMNANSI